MLFIPIPLTPKAIIDKVKTDSNINFNSWPADAAQARWLEFNGNALNELYNWLSAQTVNKFVDGKVDNLRDVLKLPTSTDFNHYKKTFELIAPYLTGKPTQPFPKFSPSAAEKALVGFDRSNPAEQPVVFEIVEANLILHGTILPNNAVNVQLILSQNDGAVLTEIYEFQVPATLAAFHFKPLLTKYLSDINYSYAQGTTCLEAYIKNIIERDQE